MTDEQGANEIKYRVASLLLLSLLERGLITHDEYVKAKKKNSASTPPSSAVWRNRNEEGYYNRGHIA